MVDKKISESSLKRGLFCSGIALVLFSGCATTRSNSIFGLHFSDQPPRALLRVECNGRMGTYQGIEVCEQKAPSIARVAVKVSPFEGRVVYSNGQMKKTEDFNWYPKEGFFLWKKKPIKDTWLDLDLGDIASSFGDWPVALDIMAISKIGVINTRGILYHRVCNDLDIPCSSLVVKYECAGTMGATGIGLIGKCDRMAGSAQAFTVILKSDGYQVPSGAKLYFTVPRTNFSKIIDVVDEAEMKIELPQIETGPTLVGVRVVWYEDQIRKALETRILIVGSDPTWTGLDKPHYINKNDRIEWVMPVFADQMEVNLYGSDGTLIHKDFGADKIIKSGLPDPGQYVCAFAWQRDSSDLTTTCQNDRLQEVPLK